MDVLKTLQLTLAAWGMSQVLGSREQVSSLFTRRAPSLFEQTQATSLSSLSIIASHTTHSLLMEDDLHALQPILRGGSRERAVINGASQAVERESQFNLIYLAYKNKIKRSRRCVITRLRCHRHSNILLAYYWTASPTRASLSSVPLRETYSSVLRNNCCLRTRGKNRIL